MTLISPRLVVAAVARQVPAECLPHLVVIGSLAAAYQLLKETDESSVRTKDMDCILVPRIEAIPRGEAVADALLAAGWQHPSSGLSVAPGTIETPDEDLPVVRLYPPDSADWFIELLTVQDAADQRDRAFERVVLSDGGHYALATFRFLDVAAYRPIETPEGIRCARVAMLALSNLLRNPVIRPERMRTPTGLGPKRSNKDLGRVLTLARLSDRAAVARWPDAWAEALCVLHPRDWTELGQGAGAGVRALLASEGDLREALEVSRAGLLASVPMSVDEFRIVAERLLADAVEPLEEAARRAPGSA